MILYTMLFFSLGAIVTWLCFCWKIDRSNSGLYKRIRALEQEDESLKVANHLQRITINMQSLKLHQEKKKCPE